MDAFSCKRGLVSGITIGGYEFGSFNFNFVCKAIANPGNEKPSIIYQEDGKDVKYFDDNVGDRVPLMLQVLAACYQSQQYYQLCCQISQSIIRVPSSYLPPEKVCETISKDVKHVVFPILV